VLGGAAGAILGLLSLHEARPDDAVLERAVMCAKHLLECRVPSPAGPRAWRTLETDQLLTGFSHGAAGIAYSLLRLYAATGHASLVDAAREAIEFERSTFSPVQKNWASSASLTGLRAEPHYFARWCYGAPGIGLARLASLSVLDEDAVRQEIDIALETTQQSELGAMDGLCCGNLGRAEILQVGGARLCQPSFSRIAHETAAAVVHRAQQRGRYSLFENMPEGITQPGFFQGTSGIGYGLLRLASPDQLPCVLAWE
jgi:lantibiotic modifying enzyme